MLFDLLAKIRNQQHHAPDAVRPKKIELIMKERLASHRQHRFGNRFGKRPQPRTKPSRQNRSLEIEFSSHRLAVGDNSRKPEGFVGEGLLTLPVFGPARDRRKRRDFTLIAILPKRIGRVNAP